MSIEKHPGGRPLKFQSVEEMTSLADKYFTDTPNTEWTVTGLCLALDIDMETIRNYKERNEFSSPLKKYYLMVHNAYEQDLRRKGRSGDIFALKNFGWKDKSEVEGSGESKLIIETRKHSDDSDT